MALKHHGALDRGSTDRLTAKQDVAPSDVAIAFWDNLRSGTLLANALISTERALAGLAIGGSIGFVLGVLSGIWRPAETFFDSSMQMLRNVPHLAIIPLVILWFGIDEEAKVFLVASAGSGARRRGPRSHRNRGG